ncbi:MAG: ABC transporter ATP-binding protein/permease [Candidatus Cloacimonetes bacterium]|nr:ABC transporter ATP-binding protein/permease [Candidatus Cloacimonadota bacterium]
MLSTVVAVVYPMIFRNLIDTLEKSLTFPTEGDPMLPIYGIIKMLVVIGIVRLVASTYPSFRAVMNLLFEYLLRKRYFAHILEKDYNFFLKFRTGDLVTRLTNDIQDFPKIGWFICSGIFRAFDSAIKIVFCVAVMFYLCWSLTFFVLLPIPLMIFIYYRVSNKLHESFKKNQEAISEIGNQLEMSFSGIKIIKSFVCEEKFSRFFRKALDTRYKTELKLVKINTLLHLVYEYIDYFSLIGIILAGGYMVVTGKISSGTFYAFFTYLTMLVYPLLDLPQLFVSGKQAFVCIDRLEEIKNFPVSEYEAEGQKPRIETIDSIRFENVSFRFESRNQNTIDSISFYIKKGEKILIMGQSGAGKTTILNLISGLLIPTEGSIYINDINIKEIEQKSLRELLGFVPQEASLFSGTIKSNIEFGIEKDPSLLPDYQAMISAVQMRDEIETFTDKDMTIIGQKGLTLSGGQKQRLAIARALYKKPLFLIFDDITASLDAQKEELLWRDIKLHFDDLTAIVVSHRLSSLRYTDSVLLLENGRIIAKGTHHDLMQENEAYADFIKYGNR